MSYDINFWPILHKYVHIHTHFCIYTIHPMAPHKTLCKLIHTLFVWLMEARLFIRSQYSVPSNPSVKNGANNKKSSLKNVDTIGSWRKMGIQTYMFVCLFQPHVFSYIRLCVSCNPLLPPKTRLKKTFKGISKERDYVIALKNQHNNTWHQKRASKKSNPPTCC